MSTFAAVYAVEIKKLAAQNRIRAVMAVLLVAPWLFIALIEHQDRLPLETLFGRYLTTTGFATPLVILVFSTQWIFPVVAALIAGDVFSSEDAQDTWKTILTRSVGRKSIFWGKVTAAYSLTVLALVVVAASATAAGLVNVGNQPLTGVGGEYIQPGAALGDVAIAWVTVILPVLGFAAIAVAVSILTRSSVLGVIVPVLIGLVMQMYTFLNAWDTVRHLLLNTPMNAWRGLLDSPAYHAPLERGVIVAAAYIVVATAVGYLAFLRRDVTGG